MKVDDEFVEEVEDECGMGSLVWDCKKRKDICDTVIKVYLKRLREQVFDREKMSDLDREYQGIIANS